MTRMRIIKNIFLIISLVIFLVACHGRPWNNPYPASEDIANFYYASFSEQPKTLDPARSYSSNEALFVEQIYEPPLQYHYLIRPYKLVPLTALAMPEISYLDNNNKPLPANPNNKDIAYTVYKIHIKPSIYFQPHPAFAKQTNDGLADKNQLSDFSQTGTRELTADDYIYEIKRLADPRLDSPIYGLLSRYIVGFPEFNALITQQYAKKNNPEQFLDLRHFNLNGVTLIDKYTYQIKIKGYYPQFIYWLAMPFFAPVPWEAEKFYSQVGMKDNNITFDWYPVGTGAYMLTENNPNRRMVLARNPNFRAEYYPAGGGRAGEKLPFIDKFIFTLEKESIPRWNKFLQGYYDVSAISSDSFDQAIRVGINGQAEVTPILKEKNIRLQTSVAPSDYYFGFNMLDPVVGGYSVRAQKLRQAISIIMDYEEFITIFLNGRGIPAQGPIPPGIFGYQNGAAGIDPFVYRWVNDHAERKSVADAKKLLIEAGYSNGRDPTTGEALLLNFDVAAGGSSDDRALFAWLRKQFGKLGIELQIRDTQYNRFQEKMRVGQEQIFSWGWLADYPDPENFLFLLYGPNGKVKYSGENATNYQNPEFDKLFVQMRDLPNGPERQLIINRMVKIVQQDAPWVWGYHPQSFVLSHNWVGFNKPNDMSRNTLKYLYIDPQLRAKERLAWNQPIVWPLGVGVLILLLILSPLIYFYWRRQYKAKK